MRRSLIVMLTGVVLIFLTSMTALGQGKGGPGLPPPPKEPPPNFEHAKGQKPKEIPEEVDDSARTRTILFYVGGGAAGLAVLIGIGSLVLLLVWRARSKPGTPQADPST